MQVLCKFEGHNQYSILHHSPFVDLIFNSNHNKSMASEMHKNLRNLVFRR